MHSLLIVIGNGYLEGMPGDTLITVVDYHM